jgi:hypothetical protein
MVGESSWLKLRIIVVPYARRAVILADSDPTTNS